MFINQGKYYLGQDLRSYLRIKAILQGASAHRLSDSDLTHKQKEKLS